MTNIAVDKTPKRTRTPIAPPEPAYDTMSYEEQEEMEETKEQAKTVNRPTRSRYFWAMVQTENSQATLMPFKTKSLLRAWLMEQQDRALLSNSIVWGWSIEAKTAQTVVF